MSKVNYCVNGRPVTEQVNIYRKNRKEEDFLPILVYYENYKDIWYAQLEDYMDRAVFDSEFDFKLLHAINSYDSDHAEDHASKKGLSQVGNFNRFFYKILTNWKSNIKTSAFRMKKRPSVTCPVCDREVGRIDEEHLDHWKTKSDLPKYMVWKNDIYEVMTKPAVYAINWGPKDPKKLTALNSGETKLYIPEKRRVRWPWRLNNGSRGVLCPFTKKVIAEISDEYIRSLPNEFSRYAQAMDWNEFVRMHPTALIQSELFSLSNARPHEDYMMDVAANPMSGEDIPDFSDIQCGKVSHLYEHTFRTIDECINDSTDRDILKMIASGYTTEDIIDILHIEKAEIKKRLRSIRDCKELENLLNK